MLSRQIHLDDGVDDSPENPVSTINNLGSSVLTSSNNGEVPARSNPSIASLDDRDSSGSLEITHNSSTPRAEDIIVCSFAPRVAVHASRDTEDLVRLKGIYGGLYSLLRPFGETINGKVVIRDSSGASRSYSNFGVQFVDFQKVTELAQSGPTFTDHGSSSLPTDDGDAWIQQTRNSKVAHHDDMSQIDNLIRIHLQNSNKHHFKASEKDQNVPNDINHGSVPQYFAHYLRKLLAGRSMVPHEMFTHPVACVIAISSQNKEPIETLRDLYNETREENRAVPPWLTGEFLRYYLLVHDEDHDDIANSTLLFNQMKRHFGLHCHLLRLRSTEGLRTNPDIAELPIPHWLTAEEELVRLEQAEDDVAGNDFQQFLFDSDATAIRTFVREMVTQSVVPFMEGRVTSWNDQVASRRRGLSGRFMSLSKKWTGFGSSRASRQTMSSNSSNGSNYRASLAAYDADVPESVMHRLADYAFMLRDWKLSGSIYDILRTDFADDKAWNHLSVVNEMLAMALLLGAKSPNTKARGDSIDQTIDSAIYSYITRCANSFGAVRCLILAIELYRGLGNYGAGGAVKWAERLLELSILSPLGQGLVVERLVDSLGFDLPAETSNMTVRHRKRAMWNFLSSQVWLSQHELELSKYHLQESERYYRTSSNSYNPELFPRIIDLLESTRQAILEQVGQSDSGALLTVPGENFNLMDEEEEDLTGGRLPYQGLPAKRFSAGAKSQAEVIELLERLNVPTENKNDGFL